jgi:4-hydroxybenzoate polyprenyltransferase
MCIYVYIYLYIYTHTYIYTYRERERERERERKSGSKLHCVPAVAWYFGGVTHSLSCLVLVEQRLYLFNSKVGTQYVLKASGWCSQNN